MDINKLLITFINFKNLFKNKILSIIIKIQYMSSYSAGLLIVDTLNVPGASGSIQASNLNFVNLDVSGNLNVGGNMTGIINNDLAAQREPFSVTASMKGSRKIAKTPFHYPEPTGKYAVDVHNVVQWVQTESCFATAKNRFSSSVYSIYVSKFGEAPQVQDYITPDGSGYNVPTKYGLKRLALSQGTCFYDASKQVFLTPPSPMNMTVYMPSTRDKTQEFSIFDSSPTVNYYPATIVSGNLDQLIYGTMGTGTKPSSSLKSYFYTDLASDSVYNLFLNYDFSAWTNADIPMTYSGKVTVTQIRNAQTLEQTSPSLANRKDLINKVMDIFAGVTQALSARQQTLLAAIKATGSYQRLLSYKWNVKVYKTYTDVSGILSTNISQTQLPSGKRPIHLYEGAPILDMMELASRGIIAIAWAYTYVGSSSRMPYGSTAPFLSPTGGVQTYNYFYLDIEPGTGVLWTSRRTNDGYASLYGFNVSNLYNVEVDNPGVGTTFIGAGNYCTGASSITYSIEMFRTLYNQLIARGFDSFTDFTKVSTQGYSGTGVTIHAASLIMENFPTFPMRFTCGICIDSPFSLPAWLIDSNGVSTGELFGSGSQIMLPNGLSIPIIVCDLNHGNYDKTDSYAYAGYPPEIQTVFRKTLVNKRADCIYHEFGDTHSGIPDVTTSSTRAADITSVTLKSDGMYYPDDAFNNMMFNHNLISLENEAIMEWVRFSAAISMYVSRFSLPNTPYSKETIKQVLPGTTTIAPYTLDDAAQNILNAVVQESIILPQTVQMYDKNIYDFSHSVPGKTILAYDLSKLKSIDLPFNADPNALPSSKVNKVTLLTDGLLNYDTSFNVIRYTGLSIYREFIPHADSSGFADTSGIDFVRGTPPNGSWKITDMSGSTWFRSGDIGTSGTPTELGSVTMSITIPPEVAVGTLNFTVQASSEAGYDFLYVYKNGAVIDNSVSGTEIADKTYSVVAGDIMKIAYMKDGFYSENDDVIYIKNLNLKQATYGTSPVATQHPTCFIELMYTDGSGSQLVDLVDAKDTPVVIDNINKKITSLKITPQTNLIKSGTLLANIEYTLVPPADSTINFSY